MKTAVLSLAALAQETRLSIYRTLVQAGPEGLAAGRIGETLGVPAATLSFHLAALSGAGLIASLQQGRFVIYTADYGAMNALLAYLTENCCAGPPHGCRTAGMRAAPPRRLAAKKTAERRAGPPRAARKQAGAR